MKNIRFSAILVIIVSVLIGFFVYNSETNPDSRFAFSYGLDLDGGTRLVYRADVSELQPQDIDGAMDTLRQTIERRVNVFGVSEPIVTVEQGSIFSADEDANRLSVELPGVTNIQDAIDAIGETPLLEFRLAKDASSSVAIFETITASSTSEEISDAIYNQYEPSGLTGGQLERAAVSFGQGSGAAVSIDFNKEGSDLLAQITKENIGRVMAIFLDKQLMSDPVIQSEILGGTAQVTGNFSIDEARELSQNLNFGALPVPIELLETNTIGPSLGRETLNAGVKALSISLLFIIAFLIIWYRLPGLVASISLITYIGIMLALFKIIPVTLTASGVAGFILSLGMAVDANILIFERMKEEMMKHPLEKAIREGFTRAWTAIRDGNTTSIIAAAILFWMSGTSLIKGFALVFGLGVIISMLTAVLVSRTLLLAVTFSNKKKFKKLFKSGFLKPKQK
jgi:protein-export membrane protein SecD